MASDQQKAETTESDSRITLGWISVAGMAMITAAIVIGLIFIVFGGRSTNGELKPLLPTRTPLPSFVIDPELVTFADLQADPMAFQDKVIRVTGDFQQLPLPPCNPHSGPGARWAIVADRLRLDVVGFEDLLHMVSEPAVFTLDGIFRLYNAPLGCGKEPAVGTTWFLEALNVVEPNPLVLARSFGLVSASGITISSLGTPTPLGVMTATPGDVIELTPGTESETATMVPTPTLDQTPTIGLTASPSIPGEQTLTATVTGTASPTTTPGTPGPTPTGGTLTPTPSSTPTLVPTGSSVPLPTATTGEGGGGYPGPVTLPPYP